MADRVPPLFVWLMALVVGSYGGVALLYFHGGLNTWLGRLLGGRGRAHELRAALAWAAAPAVVGFAVWLVLQFVLDSPLYGNAPLARVSAGVSNRTFTILTTADLAIALVIGIWQSILAIVFVADAHRFTIAKSVVCNLLAAVVSIAVVLGVIMVVPPLLSIP